MINVTEHGMFADNVDEEPQEKIKHSNFLITVSTNYRPKTTEESQAMGKKLSKTMRELLTEQTLPSIVDMLDDQDYYSVIKNVKADFSIELGKKAKGKRIHAHCLLKIEHTGKIRLNPVEIKEFVSNHIDDPLIKGIYVNIRAVKDLSNVEEYIKKQSVSNYKSKSK